MKRFVKRLWSKLICRLKGCDFGDVVYCSPSVLQFCLRCGAELQGRSFEDLEPMTEEDYDILDSLTDVDHG